jgi:HTH-type transcriptional regulator/antitoxin HigA
MPLQPIRTGADYQVALKEAERFFGLEEESAPESAEGAYFDALVTLIEAYEQKHFPIDAPTPVEAIKFRTARRLGGNVGVVVVNNNPGERSDPDT